MKAVIRITPLAATLLLTLACQPELELTYIPARPVLGEGHVCTSPLGISSSATGWYRTDGEKLRFGGGFGIGEDYVLNICGREQGKDEFSIEQALVPVRKKGAEHPDYYVCTGSVKRSGRKYSPDERLTIEMKGPHPTCSLMNGDYSHKNPKAKPPAAGAAVSNAGKTNCQRYTDCLCAISGALVLKGKHDLAAPCSEAKRRVVTKPTDPSCETGLMMYRQTATAAYGIVLPAACN